MTAAKIDNQKGPENLDKKLHCRRMWAFIKMISKQLEELNVALNSEKKLSLFVKKEPQFVGGSEIHYAVYFYFEAVLPFCEVYFKDFFEKEKVQPEQLQLVTSLAMALKVI